MKIVIIAHVYYVDLWEDIANCMANFPHGTDIHVTTPHDDPVLRSRVLKQFPDADFRVVENRGYDVAPFLTVLDDMDLSKYDYLVKLHTKRDVSGWCNYLPFTAKRWRRLLLEFCSTKSKVNAALSFMERHPMVGMMAHPALIVSKGDFEESESIKVLAEQEILKLGLQPTCRRFVAGTMFLARARCFLPLQGHVSQLAFSASPGDTNMNEGLHSSGLAHVYERVLGYLICAQRMKISDRHGLLWFYDVGYWIRMPLFYLMRAGFRLTIKRFCGGVVNA